MNRDIARARWMLRQSQRRKLRYILERDFRVMHQDPRRKPLCIDLAKLERVLKETYCRRSVESLVYARLTPPRADHDPFEHIKT